MSFISRDDAHEGLGRQRMTQDVSAVYADLSRSGGQLAGDLAHQSGLACPIWSQQSEDRALGYQEVDAVVGEHPTAVALAQVAHLDGGCLVEGRGKVAHRK
jgi:hypothetical protein